MTLKLPVIQEPGEFILSASQWEAYETCPRAAGLHYIDGVTKPQLPSAAVGTRVHEVLEDYSTKGVDPNPHEVMTVQVNSKPVKYYPGQTAEAALPNIPAPFVAVAEGEFMFRTPSGILWRGAKDSKYRVAGEQFLPPDLGIGTLVVHDYKSTSDFKWAKLPAYDREAAQDPDYPGDLETNVQSNLYAYNELEATQDPEIDLHWQYLLTKGRPAAHSVRRKVSLRPVLEQIGRIEETAKEWLEIRKAKVPAKELRPNLQMCSKYGGCPYRGKACVVTAQERYSRAMGVAEIQAMMAKKKAEQAALAAKTGGEAPPPPPPVTAVTAPVEKELPMASPPPPPPPPAPEVNGRPGYWMPGDPMNDAQEFLASKGKSLFVVSMAADVAPPHDVGLSYLNTPERGVINPPEAPPVAPASPAAAVSLAGQVAQNDKPLSPASAGSDASAPEVKEPTDQYSEFPRTALVALAAQRGLCATNTRERDATLRAKLREFDANPPAPVIKVPSIVPPPKPTTVPPPPKGVDSDYCNAGPGPKVSSIPPLSFSAGLQEQAPTRKPSHAVPPPSMEAFQGMSQPIVTLYVNCAPFGETFTKLTEILEMVQEPFRANSDGAMDYRLVDFGKGAGLLANHVFAFLAEAGPNAFPSVVVDARTDEGRVCLATLERSATRVIRGF